LTRRSNGLKKVAVVVVAAVAMIVTMMIRETKRE
jgi:hypothetical protein